MLEGEGMGVESRPGGSVLEHLSHSLGAMNAIDEPSRAGSPALRGLLLSLLGISGPKPPGLLGGCQSHSRERERERREGGKERASKKKQKKNKNLGLATEFRLSTFRKHF